MRGFKAPTEMRCPLTCGSATLHTSHAGNCNSVPGISAVAIDNKIEQAMDLVKGHLMFAVREEVEVLKERIKELWERNSELQRENVLLKSLANLKQLQMHSTHLSSPRSNPQSPQQLQHAQWVHQIQWVQQVHWVQQAAPGLQNNSNTVLMHTSVTSV